MIEVSLEVTMEGMEFIQGLMANSLAGAIDSSVLPNTSASFYEAGKHVANVWNKYLAGEGTLDGIEPLEKPIPPKDVKIKVTQNSDFDVSVKSDSERLRKIQEGENPVYYDMKQTHPYGRKSRVSAKGIPYLIIPFRWGTPNGKGTKRRWNNVIPQADYETNVKALALSRTNKDKVHFEVNAKNQDILRAGYDWARKNGRLKVTEAWEPNAVGMVRMKDVTGSTYFTFRIISAKSPAGSWLYWKDGKNPVDMMGALERTVNKKVNEIVEKGLKADLGL